MILLVHWAGEGKNNRLKKSLIPSLNLSLDPKQDFLLEFSTKQI